MTERSNSPNLRFLILRSQDPRAEARTRNLGNALELDGHSVSYLAWRRGAATTQDNSDCDVTLIGPVAPFGANFAAAYARMRFTVAMAFDLLRRRREFDAIYAIDLDTALVGAFLGRLLRKLTCVDYADFFGLPEKRGSFFVGLLNAILLRFHRIVTRFVHLVSLPDENRQYLVARRAKTVVFRNAPTLPADLVPKRAWEIDANAERVFYVCFVGQLLCDRGLPLLIDVIQRNSNLGLIVAGKGPVEAELKEASAASSRIHFLGSIPYTEALSLMRGSDCLIATYDPALANNRVASPNKLFEAIALRKPIIVAEGTSVDKLVEERQLGEVVDYGDRDQLERAIVDLSELSHDSLQAMERQQESLERTGWSGESAAASLAAAVRESAERIAR